jgi:hypothetical protein
VKQVSWSRALGNGDGAGGGAAIRGLDVDAAGVAYVAVTRAADTVVSAIGATGAPRWTWTVAGGGGPLAVAGRGAVCAIAPAPGAHAVAIGGETVKLRGEAGAVLVGLDPRGAPAWHLAASATEWAVIAAIDGHPSGDAVAVGSFAGTLRIGDAVVTSAGNSDGFAVRVDAAGAVKWLVRMGAANGDALTAVSVAGDKEIASIAVAGTVTGTADFRGLALVAHNPRLASGDIAVAKLDATGLPTWGDVLGGDLDDVATGVALLPDGGVALAGTVREVVNLDDYTLVVRGRTDAIAVVYRPSGGRLGATLLGANDTAGARGVAVAPDGRIVVGGWFSGVVRGPAGDLTADGGDDAFVAVVDKTGHVIAIDPITGPGREEVVGFAASSAGVAIGVAHTADLIALGERLTEPIDPTGGIALFVRP